MDIEFLDSKQLEMLTGTRASAWRYWASIGEGPASFKLGRRRVWKRSTVHQWLAEQLRRNDRQRAGAIATACLAACRSATPGERLYR